MRFLKIVTLLVFFFVIFVFVFFKPNKQHSLNNKIQNSTLLFNAHLILSSENMIKIVPHEIQEEFLDALLNLNVDSISINIYPEVFDEKQDIYDKIISKVKNSGKKLIIVYMVSKNTFSNKPSFKDYLKREIEYSKKIVEKYRPDYFGIVVEPSTMQKRVGVRWSLDKWISLINEVNKVVKRVSPNTKTFISLLISEGKYGLEKIACKTSVDIIGFNVWNYNQAKKLIEYKFSKKVIKCGKIPWIWMNWWSNQDVENFRSCENQIENSKWIKYIYEIAKNNSFKMISPFFTEQFVYCSMKNIPPEEEFNLLMEAIKIGFKTPSYFTYKYIIDREKEITHSLHKDDLFFIHLIIASDEAARFFNLESWLKFLDIAEESGIKAVNIYITKHVYMKKEKDYDKLIEEIKKRGFKLSLRPYVVYTQGRDFRDYYKELMEFKLELAKKYNPDFLLVANEPAFLGSQKRGKGVKVPLDIFKKYLENITKEIKKINPNIKTFVTLNKDADLRQRPEILDVVLEVKDLDIIAFNIYGAGNMNIIEEAIKKVRKYGKEVWIYETWFGAQPLPDREPTQFVMFRDCNLQYAICGWLYFMLEFKEKYNVKSILPFFTEQFVYCSNKPYPSIEGIYKGILYSLNNSRKTKSFYCLREILKK